MNGGGHYYAAAHAAQLHPKYGDRVIDDLVAWHKAFAKNFVGQTDEGPVVFGSVEFGPAGTIAKQGPTILAHRRLTYAIEGSATLAPWPRQQTGVLPS